MAARAPLVYIDGKLRQLPPGDSVVSSGTPIAPVVDLAGAQLLSLPAPGAGNQTTVTKPAGLAVGDYWFVAIEFDIPGSIVDAPSGWSSVTTGRIPSAVDGASFQVFYYRITGAEGASQVFATSANASAQAAISFRVSGMSNIEVFTPGYAVSAATPITPGSDAPTTTMVDGCTLLWLGAADFQADGIPAWTAPAGYTGLVTANAPFCSVAAATKAQGLAGTEPITRGSATLGATLGGSMGILIALAPSTYTPAPTGGGGGGSVTGASVTLDFGTVPVKSRQFTFAAAGATTASRVLMSASPDPTGAMGGDELEMDGFDCAAYCATNGFITAYVVANPGPVKGARNFNYLLV